VSDQPVGSAATFFDTTGKAASGAGLRRHFREPTDILRAFGIRREVRTEPPIPAEARAALGLPAEAEIPESLPAGSQTATACFELHIGSVLLGPGSSQGPFVVPFNVTVDLTTTPYNVLSGTFIFPGTEVTTWEWKITQGNFGVTGAHFGVMSSPSVLLTDTLYILGEYLPIVSEGQSPDSANVPSVLILGSLRPPVSYPGLFVSASGLWDQNTLFRGWQACS
jgi:hypothetical protein